MRRVFAALFFCLLVCVVAHAQFWIGLVNGGPVGWQQVRIDGGGFVTGSDIECDQGSGNCSPGTGTVTRVVRTDTAGAWLWNGTKWQQLITFQSFPDNGFGNFYGVCEIRVAPSNTNHLYLYFTLGAGNLTSGNVYESLNKGVSWTKTGFSSIPCDAASATARLNGPYEGIDPANDAVMYLGPPNSGIWFTTNGGNGASTSFNEISTGTIPAATGGFGSLIGFDVSGGTTGGKTNNIVVAVYNQGVYRSTNAGGAWTKLNTTGMPTTFTNMHVDRNGTIWVVDNVGANNTGNLWNWVSGTGWTKVITTGGGTTSISAVTTDPNNCASAGACHVFAVDFHGYVWVSVNGGATFTLCNSGASGAFLQSATTNPWMTAASDTSIALISLAFDPSVSNMLYATGGTGVWSTSPPSSNISTTEITWNGNATAGIQNLVATSANSVPSGGPIMLTAEDRALWLITDPTTPQANYFPTYVTNNHIDPGWTASYMLSTPTTLFETDTQYSGQFSTSSGALNSWSQLAALPAAFPSNGNGGDILAYSNANAIWNVDDLGGPYCLTAGTMTGTPTWSACTLPSGRTTAGGGWSSGNTAIVSHQLALDQVATSTYCLYNNGSGSNTAGLYSSTNGTSFSFVAGSGQFDSVSTAVSMFAVPANQGHFYAAAAPDVHGTLPNTNLHLWRTTGGCGGTWAQVPNVESLFGFSFGKACPGGDGYPALFVIGWVNQGSGYNYGFYRSDNADAGTPAWTKIGDGYPNGNFDWIKFIQGDINNCGTVYVGFGGSGYAYRRLNYLLKRDLGHDNDNTPVGLNEAA